MVQIMGAKGKSDEEKKKEKGEEEKGTKKERREEMQRDEEEQHDRDAEGDGDEDDDDDDVVVIDSIPSQYSSLLSIINPAPIPDSSSTSSPKMDPPPPSSALRQPAPPSSQGQWFSPASFLPPSAGPNDDPSSFADPNMQNSASAGAQRLLAELRQRYQQWSVFFRFSKFGCPPGLVAIGPRIKRNLATFTANYLCLFAVLLLYCVLTSLLMLLTLVVLGGLLYSVYQFTRNGPVVIGSYEIPPSLLYTLALMLSIPFFWLADAGSVMYWVLGSGLFLMLAHSTFYASEEVPGSEFEVVVSA